ncbi:bifunctional 5-dehydro-2-deoxygluconokinase/5-dehydro-2-deoxyphosphogluconate aldolase [Paraburkholderia bannensis]|uniref:bifunctional 5-dehydro-2-deoxygluconokinase/5-dehydro-2- deoxyphosphogluconate aldolase n=1 Tax=Paraburkholderia bannensis TaxID=765414 RepID=UPI002AAFC930|nr:5-dehydro-2-deoxygluconokinase [Paraburkholderia bannensis]
MQTPTLAPERKFDVICLGRLAVDLYAQQIGAPLEDVTGFARYLGGSSANIAFGCARLGLKSAMLSRVGNDHMGRFLVEALNREGCDTSHVSVDAQRLTALVLLGLKDRETFPLVFYRENCADMALDEADFDESFIASSRALLITGTHFSTPQVHRASMKALEYARRNNVRTVLDIDYRPVLWGLTGKADGETRFIADGSVSEHMRGILPMFDLIVGTEEEFRIAGGRDDIIEALHVVRGVTAATLVVKRGPLGCAIIDEAIPPTLDDARNHRGVQVEVLNVLGAGDAFISGFLKGWLTGENEATSFAFANACGALVVSRHACAPAMPTPAELDYFLTNVTLMKRPDRDARLAHLHRVSPARKEWNEVLGFAFDHRDQLFALAQQAGVDEARISTLKQLFVEAVAETESQADAVGKIAVLIDDRYGQDALNSATGRDWWIGRPVELPGSNPLQFEHGRSIGSALVSWPREHIVKCLVQYHPDDEPAHRTEQENQLRALYDAVKTSGHELLLEVIPPKDRPNPSGLIVRALERLYDLGIAPDWWKLESPRAEEWRALDTLIEQRDPWCRGVVLLGLNAPVERLAEGFIAASASRTCRGFTVGRTIFYEPSRAWLAGEIDDRTLINQVRANFEALIGLWRRSRPQQEAA